MNKIVLAVMAVLLGAALMVPDAEAARVGGGRSVGAQRSITNAPPAAAPARQAQQTQQAAPAGAQAQPQPASGLSRWAPILGGLAIGGLLGAMFGGSGIGSMLMSWLLIGLAVFAVMFLIRLLAQRRAAASQPMQYAAGGAPGGYQSIGNETVAAPPPSQAAGFEVPSATMAAPNVPAGFDVGGFLRAAKLNFMKLQLANDAGNLDELREFSTPELYAEMSKDLLARGGNRQQTDVVSLNADLLEVVSEADRHWASVRFSGQIRETPGAAPEGFEEVWNLSKPVDGSSGWLLAGIQQMH